MDYWSGLNNCSDSIEHPLLSSLVQRPILPSPMLTTSDVPSWQHENTSAGGDSYMLGTGDGSYYDLFDSQTDIPIHIPKEIMLLSCMSRMSLDVQIQLRF